MVLALAFHYEDPDGVGDALNAFLFPYLYPSAGLEAGIPTKRCYTVFYRGTLTYLTATRLILCLQKVSPAESWDEEACHLEAWEFL